MKITGIVHVDLACLVDEYGHIDELAVEARERWCQLESDMSLAPFVRIDIGAAGLIDWPAHFVCRLVQASNVQIVGTYPESVTRAVEDIRKIAARLTVPTQQSRSA